MKKVFLMLVLVLWASIGHTEIDDGIMRIGDGKILENPLRAYNFLFNGTSDRVSHTDLPAANYTTAHYNLHGTELKTYGSDEYVRDAQGRILTFGSYKQLCLYSENPGAAGWVPLSCTVSSNTDDNIGPFLAHRVFSSGNVAGRVRFWRSLGIPASGAPVGIIYVRLYYLAGQGNKIRILFYDGTALLVSDYSGTIGSTSVTSQAAGSLTLISDTESAEMQCRIVTLKMGFTNKANSLEVGVGPYSTIVGDYITVLGADIFGDITSGDITTWRPHVPSNGSVVSVSATKYDYNSGSPRGPRLAFSTMPDAVIGLQGSGPGDAQGQIEWTGTPLFNAADTAADGKIITVNETGTLLAHTANGEFKFADGINTNLVDADYVKDTGYLVKSLYGTHPTEGAGKMQTIVNETASAVGDFDGSFNPDAFIGIGGSDFPMAHTSLKIKKRPSW